MWFFDGCSVSSCCGRGDGSSPAASAATAGSPTRWCSCAKATGGDVQQDEYRPCTRATAEEGEDLPSMTVAAAAAEVKARGGKKVVASPKGATFTPSSGGAEDNQSSSVPSHQGPSTAPTPPKAGGLTAPKAKAKPVVRKTPQQPSSTSSQSSADRPKEPGASSSSSAQPAPVIPEPVFPEGLRFEVTLTKGVLPFFGIDLTPAGDKCMEVHTIQLEYGHRMTAVGAWNRDCATDPTKVPLREGDLITSMNNGKGSIKEMWKSFKNDKTLVCSVYRAPVIEIEVQKLTTLGVNIQAAEVSLFMEVIHDGPFSEWSERHPDKEVLAGDRILAVQGQRGRSAELLEKLKASSGAVKLLIARGPPEHCRSPRACPTNFAQQP